jgi:transcriptional regulator with XRE-family HTH domain
VSEAYLPPTMNHTVNLSDLGRRVRAARLARRLTLEEVVSRTDFTVSWLSKLENGLLAPSLDGLVRLAAVLECGVDSLVEGLSIPPQYVVVKRGNGTLVPARGGIVREALADQWRDRQMHPVILHVSGGGSRKQPDSHDGERFLLVLEGEVRVTYGDEQIQLASGDSIYIHAAIPHTIAAAGRGGAKVLSVAYDPAAADMPVARRGRRSASVNGATTRRKASRDAR